jgi:hypothetical protein
MCNAGGPFFLIKATVAQGWRKWHRVPKICQTSIRFILLTIERGWHNADGKKQRSNIIRKARLSRVINQLKTWRSFGCGARRVPSCKPLWHCATLKGHWTTLILPTLELRVFKAMSSNRFPLRLSHQIRHDSEFECWGKAGLGATPHSSGLWRM